MCEHVATRSQTKEHLAAQKALVARDLGAVDIITTVISVMNAVSLHSHFCWYHCSGRTLALATWTTCDAMFLLMLLIVFIPLVMIASIAATS